MQLYNEDCLEWMKRIPDGSIDAIITDPPYWTTACKWDSVIPFEPMWAELKRIIKPNGAIVLFGSEPFSSALRMSNIKMYKYDIYWKKEKPTNFFQLKRRPWKLTENIIVFYDKQVIYNPQKYKVDYRVSNKTNKKHNSIVSWIWKEIIEYKDDWTRFPWDILEINREKLGSTVHPTQKPVALIEYLIKTYTNEWETVLDFTFGSWTTAIACLNTNRHFIWFEMDKWYFDIAQKRIEDYKNLLYSNIV